MTTLIGIGGKIAILHDGGEELMTQEKKRIQMTYFVDGLEYDPTFEYYPSGENYYQCPECTSSTDDACGDHTRVCKSCGFDERNGTWQDIYDENHEEKIQAFETQRLYNHFGRKL